MYLKLINFIVGFFGYEYILDNRPKYEPPEDIEADEGWDDIHGVTPTYRLIKKPKR